MEKRRVIAGKRFGVRSFTMFWAMGLILFLVSVPVFAQLASGTILGVVKDTSGGTVAGATVTVTNTETSQSRTVSTEADGSYRFPGMLVGHYTLKVEKEGFKTSTQTGLVLDVSQELVANASMEVGSAEQQVVVTSEAPLVNTTTSALGGLVDENRMADLPLNGRNYMDLSVMQPGTSQNKAMGNSHGTVGTWYSSNGAPVRSNMVSLDGANMMTLLGGAATSEAGTTLGLDGIREIKVVTTSFSAEYGQSMGSQMLMVSKGGTNQWHGDAFDYIRNSALDAANYFDTPASSGGRRLPEFQKNNFGGSFGGPIRKDKTFFYTVYEGVRQNVGFTPNDTVPRAGCHPPGATLANNFGAGAVIWNGAGTQPAGSVGNCPDLGSTVDVNGFGQTVTLSAVTAPFLALFPTPNVGATHYSFPGSNRAGVNYGQVRIDQNISSADSFFGRYTIDDTIVNNVNQSVGNSTNGVAFPQFGLFASGRNQFATLAENHIFSPTVLNTARLSMSRTTVTDRNKYVPNPGDPPLDSPFYQLVAGVPIGDIVVTGYSTIGGNSGFGPPDDGQIQTVYTLSDDLFYTRGKHAFKYGLLVNRYYQGVTGGLRTEGQATFQNLAGLIGNASSTWIGHLASTTPLENYNRYYIFNTFGMYAQDDYRATSKLTLNLGLRYEFMTTPTERNNRSYAIRNVWSDAATTQGPPVSNYSLRNFSPRIGFAYDPFGNGKTSIRGAFGIYYDVGNIGVTMEQALLGTSPLITTCTVTNSTPAAITVPLVFTTNGNCATLFTNQYNAQQPHTLQYNLTLDRQFPGGFGLTVSYVGLRGIHIWTNREGNPTQMGLNQTVTIGGKSVTEYSTTVNGQEYFSQGIGTCSTVIPSCRMNPNFDAMQFVQTTGDSYYNSLQVVVNKRLGHGLELQSAYTYAQNLDTTQANMDGNDCGSGGATGFDPLNPQNDKGPSCSDVRHNWRANFLYRPPSLNSNGVLSKFANGWTFANIFAAQTGYPFTPTLTSNRSFSGVFSGLTGQGDRPNLVTAATAGSGAAGTPGAAVTFVPYDPKTVIVGTVQNWYNPLMFNLPPIAQCPGQSSTSLLCGTLGDESRGFLRAPGLFNWDFSIVKDTKLGFLGEQGALQFRAEFFNILNHVNLGFPSTASYAGSTKTSDIPYNSETPAGFAAGKPMGTAGQITTSANSRQIQLALKLIF